MDIAASLAYLDPSTFLQRIVEDIDRMPKPPLPIQQCRLSEIPRHVLRVECMRCLRIVEMQKLDAIRFYGSQAVWKDVGQRLLDQTCTNRTGRHEEDGCWPDWAD